MNILVVTQYFWPETFRINDMAQGLKDMGHDITVLTGLPNYPSGKWTNGYGLKSCGREEWQGIKIIRVPLMPRMKGRGWQLALNYLSFAFSSSLLGPVLCRDQYDVIFTYEPSPFTVGIPAIVMRRLRKIPMIFWVQDLWPESLKSTGAVSSEFVLASVGRMVKWIYRRCDKILVQSEAFIEPAIKAGANPDIIRYFPNWAEEFYRPVSVDESSALAAKIPKGFVVMFAGNLGEAQSLPTIIAAALKLKEINVIHWVVIGDGRRMDWMREEVTKLGLNNCVHFLGRHPTEQMPSYFSAADILLATLKDEPAFAHTIPSKVQTYMACGRPVIAAMNGEGARVIKQSGGGLAVQAEDDQALADAVMTIYNLPEEQRQTMGKAAYVYYQNNYDRKLLLNKLETIMSELIEKDLCAS